MNSTSLWSVRREVPESGDLIHRSTSGGFHGSSEGASRRSLLDHALSFTPQMDSAALRAWAQAAKYLAERDRAAESKAKHSQPLGDPWAEGARTAISFLDPLVNTESWPSIQMANYYSALAKLKAMISQRERLVRQRRSMSM